MSERDTLVVDASEVESDLRKLTDAVRSKEQIVPLSATKLAEYGERELIREMAARLIMLHPQAHEIGPAGMAAAAQIAVFAGASPLPGLNELHVWQDSKTKQPVIMLGINYDRRRVMEVADGVAWIDKPRPMTMSEREDYGVNQGDIAFICKGLRQDLFIDLYQAGISLNDIHKTFGATGVGIVMRSEYDKKGRPKGWTAEKRAEADLCRKLVPNLADPDRAAALAQSRQNLLRLDALANVYTGDQKALPVEAQKVAMRAHYGLIEEEQDFELNGQALDLEVWLSEMKDLDEVCEAAAKQFGFESALHLAQTLNEVMDPSGRKLADLTRMELWELAEAHEPTTDWWTASDWKAAVQEAYEQSKVNDDLQVTEPQRRSFFRLLAEAGIKPEEREPLVNYLFSADGLSSIDRRSLSAFLDVAIAREKAGCLSQELPLLIAAKRE